MRPRIRWQGRHVEILSSLGVIPLLWLMIAPGFSTVRAAAIVHPWAIRAGFWHGVVMNSLLSRITIDPAVCHGTPCIRGLRYPVEMLLELLSSGMTVEEILDDYEDLEREDLAYA